MNSRDISIQYVVVVVQVTSAAAAAASGGTSSFHRPRNSLTDECKTHLTATAAAIYCTIVNDVNTRWNYFKTTSKPIHFRFDVIQKVTSGIDSTSCATSTGLWQ